MQLYQKKFIFIVLPDASELNGTATKAVMLYTDRKWSNVYAADVSVAYNHEKIPCRFEFSVLEAANVPGGTDHPGFYMVRGQVIHLATRAEFFTL